MAGKWTDPSDPFGSITGRSTCSVKIPATLSSSPTRTSFGHLKRTGPTGLRDDVEDGSGRRGSVRDEVCVAAMVGRKSIEQRGAELFGGATSTSGHGALSRRSARKR